MANTNDIPRRYQLDKNTPEELNIRKAIEGVEIMGADPILTNVVTKLNEAKELLADYFDKWPRLELLKRIEQRSLKIGVIGYSHDDLTKWAENTKLKWWSITPLLEPKDFDGQLFDEIHETEVGSFNVFYSTLRGLAERHLIKK